MKPNPMKTPERTPQILPRVRHKPGKDIDAEERGDGHRQDSNEHEEGEEGEEHASHGVLSEVTCAEASQVDREHQTHSQVHGL